MISSQHVARSTSYQIKAARFPAYRDLTGFDFVRSQVNDVDVEVVGAADNVVLVDGPGTGKTEIARAVGV